MRSNTLHFKVILPSRPALERSNVVRLTVPTPSGILHLPSGESDLMAAVIPGLVVWTITGVNEESMTLEQGILIKTGKCVLILTRGHLENARKCSLLKFPNEPESEASKFILTKMKQGFIDSVVKFGRP